MSVVRRAAVLGSPIAHSLSPLLHQAAYADLGLTGWGYEAHEVGDAAGLSAFLDGCGPEWAGLSLTMPLKRSVQPLLDHVTPTAAAVGSVNTVLLGPSGRSGHNTDVLGVRAALAEAGVVRLSDGSGVVLGGGATAASAVTALVGLGDRTPNLLVRSPERAREAVDAAERAGGSPRVRRLDDGADVLAAAVVVSTVPASAGADVAALVRRAAQVPGVLLDVVYDPWPTEPALAWQAAGGTVVDGFVMLLHQALEQVRLMTGRAPSVEVVRAAGLAALKGRSGPSDTSC